MGRSRSVPVVWSLKNSSYQFKILSGVIQTVVGKHSDNHFSTHFSLQRFPHFQSGLKRFHLPSSMSQGLPSWHNVYFYYPIASTFLTIQLNVIEWNWTSTDFVFLRFFTPLPVILELNSYLFRADDQETIYSNKKDISKYLLHFHCRELEVPLLRYPL